MISCNRNFYSMPRILRRVCSNLWQRRKPLISLVGNLSYRSNIRVDCKAYADFQASAGHAMTCVGLVAPGRSNRRTRFRGAEHSRKRTKEGERPDAVSDGVPRVAKLMALAIRFDQSIRDGVVPDQSELAALGRVSQILALLQLAPDIQEAITQALLRPAAQLGSLR